jgi:two-component system CheB/CheR fusion protein
LSTQQSFQDVEIEYIFPAVGRKVLRLTACSIEQADERGKKRLILLAMEDITERRDLERQKEALLGMVSHELKTPLTSALLYTELLKKIFQRERVGNEQVVSYLQKVVEQHHHLAHYIGDLLDATATEAGILSLTPVPFALEEVIRDAAEVLIQTNPNIHMLIEGEMNARAFADSQRVSQVLVNLLSNAIKYGASVQPISIRVEVNDHVVTVSVQDHGPGIPAETQGQIFERFYRGRNTVESGIPGLGLGLYLASKLVRASGGEIWVESSLGSGTTFSFTLPRGDRMP